MKWYDDVVAARQDAALGVARDGLPAGVSMLARCDGDRPSGVAYSFFPFSLQLAKRAHKDVLSSSPTKAHQYAEEDGTYYVRTGGQLEVGDASSSAPGTGKQFGSKCQVHTHFASKRNLPAETFDNSQYWFVDEVVQAGRGSDVRKSAQTRWVMDSFSTKDEHGTTHRYCFSAGDSAEDIAREYQRLLKLAKGQLKGAEVASASAEKIYMPPGMFKTQRFPHHGRPCVMFHMRHVGAMRFGFADYGARPVSWCRYGGIYVS